MNTCEFPRGSSSVFKGARGAALLFAIVIFGMNPAFAGPSVTASESASTGQNPRNSVAGEHAYQGARYEGARARLRNAESTSTKETGRRDGSSAKRDSRVKSDFALILLQMTRGSRAPR